MKLMTKSKLLSVEKRSFKPENSTDSKEFWWITLEDPDNDRAFSLKLDKDLGDGLFANNGGEVYLNKECIFEISVTYYGVDKKYTVTDIQLSSNK